MVNMIYLLSENFNVEISRQMIQQVLPIKCDEHLDCWDLHTFHRKMEKYLSTARNKKSKPTSSAFFFFLVPLAFVFSQEAIWEDWFETSQGEMPVLEGDWIPSCPVMAAASGVLTQLCLSAPVAITKYHSLCGFNNGNVFSHSSERWKSKIKARQVRALLRTLWQMLFCRGLTWWREKRRVYPPLLTKAPTLSD